MLENGAPVGLRDMLFGEASPWLSRVKIRTGWRRNLSIVSPFGLGGTSKISLLGSQQGIDFPGALTLTIHENAAVQHAKLPLSVSSMD